MGKTLSSMIDQTPTGWLLHPRGEGVEKSIELITERQDSDAWRGWWQGTVAQGANLTQGEPGAKW